MALQFSYDQANGPAVNFDAPVRQSNDWQMSHTSMPVTQQLQQIQPQKKQ